MEVLIKLPSSPSATEVAIIESIDGGNKVAPFKALELELRPEKQMTESRFDRILLVQIAIGTNIEQVDIERGDVVVVGEVLRLNAEDEHAAIEVEPC